MKCKVKTKCEECGKLCNNIYGPYLNLCRICFNKSKIESRIPNGPMKFKDELTESTSIGFHITKLQKEEISNRLDVLYPQRNKEYHELDKLSLYARDLILKDVEKHSKIINKASLEVRNDR